MQRTIWCATLLIAGALTVGCAKPATRPPHKQATKSARQAVRKGSAPALNVSGQAVKLFWEDKGSKALTVTAREMSYNSDGTAKLSNATAKLYQQGKLAALLVAPVIQADEKTKVAIASGGVTLTSSDTRSAIRTVKAQRIKWSSRDNKILAEGGVRATGPHAFITGSVLVADTRMRTVRVMANPKEARAAFSNH
jgi:hypothetical protein